MKIRMKEWAKIFQPSLTAFVLGVNFLGRKVVDNKDIMDLSVDKPQ